MHTATKLNPATLPCDTSCPVANLEENDKIKAELKPVKISEPKTPYHGPLDMDGLPDEGTLRRNLAGQIMASPGLVWCPSIISLRPAQRRQIWRPLRWRRHLRPTVARCQGVHVRLASSGQGCETWCSSNVMQCYKGETHSNVTSTLRLQAHQKQLHQPPASG